MTPSTQEQTNQTKNKKFLKIFGIIVGAIVLVIIIASISTGGNDETETADVQQVTSEEQQLQELADSIGHDNTKAYYQGTSLTVDYTMSPARVDDIALIAQDEAAEALKAAAESGLDYERIIIKAEHPTQDEYGNDDEPIEALDIIYEADTVDQINWDNFSVKNMWKIRDGGKVHPDLEDN